MRTRAIVVFAVAALLAVFAVQSRAQAYRRGRGGYGYGYFNPLAAMGQLVVSNSQAAINYQKAYSAYMDNMKKREETYFEMRRMNASYRAEMEMQRPHPTPEQIVEFNKSRLPAALSPEQWDPAQNIFQWPQVLAGKDFDADRKQIEDLFMARVDDPYHSGLGSQNCRDIEHAVEAMNDRLHAKIDKVSADEYLGGSKFLKRLSYAARTDASAPAAVAAAK